MSNSQQATGIDVSHYQGTVDWAEVKSSGSSFAFAKATESVSVVDSMFATNWAAMKGAGLIRGAYHFFHANASASDQAEHFLQVVTFEPGDLPPVLDVESGGLGGASASALNEGVSTWIEAVKQQTGLTPMIYVSPSFANDYLQPQFGECPLWVAEYGVSSPVIPKGWQAWTFWQHSQSGQVAGVNGSVDLDTFNGSEAQLRAFAHRQTA